MKKKRRENWILFDFFSAHHLSATQATKAQFSTKLVHTSVSYPYYNLTKLNRIKPQRLQTGWRKFTRRYLGRKMCVESRKSMWMYCALQARQNHISRALLRCFFLVQITAKIANGGTPINRSACLHSLFQSYDLLIQHHKFLLHHHVFMVVPEEPVFETAAFPDFIEKNRQGIPLVQSTVECILDAAGAVVGYDVVHIPACLVQRCYCGSVFILAGQFLFPTGSVVNSE